MKEEILRLTRCGYSRQEVANMLHLTKGTVSGIIDRHKKPDRYKRYLKGPNPQRSCRWTDERLTEPWAQFYQRKQDERRMDRV